MFCAEFVVEMTTFETLPKGKEEAIREAITQESMILSGFASYVVTKPRMEGQKHNITAYAEREIGALREYYEHMLRRTPRSGKNVDLTSTLHGVTRGLRNLYPSAPTVRVPLVADDMR